MKVSTKNGQAMIEFVAGLLVLLLLIIAFVHVSKLALSSLGIHGEIRADAGISAMQSTLADAPEPISDWESGKDETRFTADDDMQKNQPAAASIIGSVVSHSVRDEGDWTAVSKKSESVLPFSMVKLSQSPNLTTLMGAVHESKTDRVPIDPFIRNFADNFAHPDLYADKEDTWWMPLVSRKEMDARKREEDWMPLMKEDVAVKEEIWMPLMGGLY